MKLSHALLAALLSLHGVGAWAQWQWLDKDGRKVFSDRAPNPDVPEKNIIKRPGNRGGVSVAAPTPVAAASAASAASPGAGDKAEGVDKTLEAKKKQAEQAEAAKQKQEADRIAKAKAENCKRAQQAKVTFDSGVRISRTNAQGEREIMDDAARAAEQQRIDGIINTECR
jgi:predicted component of type VI protein secretion system